MTDSKDSADIESKSASKISWKSSDSYENFMGRWSRLVARAFIEWLSPSTGLIWLDVGCGSGALSKTIIDFCKPAQLTALDHSDGFVKGLQKQLGNLAHCQVGNAVALPVKDDTVHLAVSGLVLNFIAEPIKALLEMKRVIAPGGISAIYVWDYSGKMEFLNKFWDAAATLDPKAASLHEVNRFTNSSLNSLKVLFKEAGFVDIESTPIEIETRFRDFNDYWNPFLGGQGPAPTYLMSLDDARRAKLRDRLFELLPNQRDGSIIMNSRAWAIRGKVAL